MPQNCPEIHTATHASDNDRMPIYLILRTAHSDDDDDNNGCALCWCDDDDDDENVDPANTGLIRIMCAMQCIPEASHHACNSTTQNINREAKLLCCALMLWKCALRPSAEFSGYSTDQHSAI